MDKLILDFEGEMLEIPSDFAYERSLTQLGMQVEHNGRMYTVVGRYVLGVDAVAAEYAAHETDETPMKNELTLVVKLVEA